MARVVKRRQRKWLTKKEYQILKAEAMMTFLRRYGLLIVLVAMVAMYLGF